MANELKTRANVSLGSKLEEQLVKVAKVLRKLEWKDKDKEAIENICTLLEEGKLQNVDAVQTVEKVITEINFIPLFSEEQKKAISDFLTVNKKPMIQPEEVEDAEKLLGAIQKYVESTNSVLGVSGKIARDYQKQVEELNKTIEEANKTIKDLENDRKKAWEEYDKLLKEKTNMKSDFARHRRASRITTAAVAAVLSASTLAAGFFHIGLPQKNKDKAELDEIRAILSENGYEGDLSDGVKDLYTTIGEMNKGGNATPETDPELDEIKGALGDHYTEGSDLSDVVSGVVDDLDSTKTELGNTQTELNTVKEQLESVQGKLDEIEEILVKNGVVSEGDVSAALEQFIDELNKGSVTPDDGITQDDVNAVYQAIATAFAELGITEDDLKGADGNYTTEKINEVFAELIEGAIEDKVVIDKTIIKTEAMLGKFINEETGKAYTLQDFNSLEEALDFVEDELDKFGETIEKLNVANRESEAKRKDAEDAYIDLQYEFATSREEYELAIKGLMDMNAALQAELAKDRNPGQNGTGNGAENDSNTQVSDKEVDDSTSPSQDNKNNSLDNEEDEPGN